MPVVMVRGVFPAKDVRRCRSTLRPSAASRRSPASGWTTSQIAQLQAELNGILGWIEQLNEVDVEGDRAADRRGANGTEDA